MTFCFCIDDDTHVVVHVDVIHRDYSRVINKCGKKNVRTDGAAADFEPLRRRLKSLNMTFP